MGANRGLMGRDMLSMQDFSKEDILKILATAKKLAKIKSSKVMQGKILGSLFFEPSTRTRLSFESSMAKLGGASVGFADASVSSVTKGESLLDTIKMVQQYADLLVIRHPQEGAARLAAEATDKPVINAGDGANQHPTQTLVDLYTIQQLHGRLDRLKIAIVGDLRYGRTVHSLIHGLSHFSSEVFLISPDALRLPESYREILYRGRIRYHEGKDFTQLLPDLDVLYMTRIQKERFADQSEYQAVKSSYALTATQLQRAKPTLKVLHPLPRITEISQDVDETPHAAYFLQASNGIPVRQAVLGMLAGVLR